MAARIACTSYPRLPDEARLFKEEAYLAHLKHSRLYRAHEEPSKGNNFQCNLELAGVHLKKGFGGLTAIAADIPPFLAMF